MYTSNTHANNLQMKDSITKILTCTSLIIHGSKHLFMFIGRLYFFIWEFPIHILCRFLYVNIFLIDIHGFCVHEKCELLTVTIHPHHTFSWHPDLIFVIFITLKSTCSVWVPHSLEHRFYKVRPIHVLFSV